MGYRLDEIVIIPGAFLDAVADGNFVDIGCLKHVSGDAIEQCCVGRGVVLAGAGLILAQMNVEHPMQPVLDLPMSPCEVERLLRRRQCRGHEQARQRFGLVAPAGDADEGFVVRHQRLGRGHDLSSPPLLAAMAGFGPLRDSGGDLGQSLFGVSNPMPAIALEGK